MGKLCHQFDTSIQKGQDHVEVLSSVTVTYFSSPEEENKNEPKCRQDQYLSFYLSR